MTTVPTAVAVPGRGEATPGRAPGGRGSGWAVPVFLGPAAVLLGAIVVYPTVATVARSLYDKPGDRFVGLGNYRAVFGTTALLVAIRNNAIWVIVFPALVTTLGLLFAVLTERVRWATAFKVVVFMPMAISLFAAGLIWRIVYETDPHRGLVNAAIAVVGDAVDPPGAYRGAAVKPTTGATGRADGSLLSAPVVAGQPSLLGFTGISPDAVPPGAKPAVPPASPAAGTVTGVVWRDFSPRGTAGQVDPGELGLPGVHLALLDAAGRTVGHATSELDGGFTFDHVGAGEHRVVVERSNFTAGFQGVDWLGTKSITPTSHLGETGRALLSVPLVVLAEVVAMLWIWSGFSMVVIGAGLAGLDREVLEAARMDGASEVQVFRRITLPLLRPVLVVVLVTMVINVLKIFDIVLAVAPDASQGESNVIALEMWRVGFTGTGDFGRSSAIAVLLFLLVVPVMLLNVRRIKG